MSTRALAAVLAVIALPACGYTLVQAGPPFGAQRVAVVPFVEDDTIGIAGDLAAELAQRLAASGVILTSDRAGADAVLTGRLEPLIPGSAPVANPTAAVTLFRITMVANVVLTRGKTELWRARVAAVDDYQAVAPSPYGSESGVDLGTESRRREALRRASRTLARAIGEQLAIASATTLTPAIAPPQPPAPAAKPAPTAPAPGAAAPATPPPAGATVPGASSPAPPATGIPTPPPTPPGVSPPVPPG